jgi:hypothetical protein
MITVIMLATPGGPACLYQGTVRSLERDQCIQRPAETGRIHTGGIRMGVWGLGSA